jgi:sec-independent protein translocase protein TatA
MNFGTTEILLVAAIIFLLFGASRLPQLAKSLGQSRKAFKDGMREAEEESRLEEEQQRINSTQASAPQISKVTDEELLDEARRRATLKQQS